MADLYVGADGVIHSGTGRGVQGAVSVNTSNHNARSTPGTATYTANYATGNYVSAFREILFWVFAGVMGILIGVGLSQAVGVYYFTHFDAEFITEEVQEWYWNISPWLFAIAGFAGSIYYGFICAEDRNYDLCAFVLAALSAVGGIVAGIVALALLWLVVSVVAFIICCAIVIAIVAAIFGAFE